MDNGSAKKPTFLWRGILILLPLFLLAGAGLYSLRQDRQLAQIEARQRCQNLADNYVAAISNKLFSRILALGRTQKLSQDIVLDWHGNLHFIGDSRERAQLPRDPIPLSLPESELSPAQGDAWRDARKVEFAGGDASNAIMAWRKFIGLSPSAPFMAQARYNLGLLLAGRDETTAADQIFREVQNDRQAVTESGLPLWLLAELQRVELAPSKPGTIYQDAVNTPSFATPIILARLEQLEPSMPATNRYWLEIWQKDQEARDFYLHVRPELPSAKMATQTFWTRWDGDDWLVALEPGKGIESVQPFEKTVVLRALRDVLSASLPQPGYADFGVEIDGKPVVASDSRQPVLAAASATWLPDGTNNVTVREFLTQPALLYAQQRRRTVWFAGLILVSAMVAVAGFVSAYRGFHQQLRLGELKSNFVSSVSHELRAPIASMRLMAESLQRGKVAGEAKQKEYFGFLVQESRRLSSLIENILDYSRIDQGRKKYRFEPTDLEVLVEQTIALMQPCAAERGVELKLENDAGAAPDTVQCDGLAVQQALINLIDNAIKHSPAGAAVTVGVERAAGQCQCLWVEDKGPGIPLEDHERIFERFYRRGSELRRETQGIGIGLTIVKHTVEAHGGRVTVRSAAGQGSRFAMILPNQPPAANGG